MKLLSYIFVIVLPLMCSSPKGENGPAIYSDVDEEVFVDDASNTNDVNSMPSEASPLKIIKTSYLKFETKDLDSTYLHIKKAVQNNKGFIQDDNSNKSYNMLTRRLTIRIPTNNFQNTLDAVSKNVSYFDTKRVSAKDVSEEFIDLEARLKAKRTLEKRYLELLSRARNVKEMLEIERELSNIREEIEAKQGRLKYLQNRVSLSTLEVEFYKLTSEAPVATSYGTKMWNAIKAGLSGVSIFFLGLLHIWPFLLLLIIAGVFLVRWFKKMKK